MSSSTSSEFYVRSAFYAPEDIIFASKAEDEEQLRRIADVEGENHKRVLAHNLSELFGESLRATWFQRGSGFVLSLLGSVRTAVTSTASDLTNTVSEKAGDLGYKAAQKITSTADSLAVKSQQKAYEATNIISDKAGEVGLKAQAKAHEISDTIANKAVETASAASYQAQTAALNLKERSLDTAQNVSSLAQGKALDIKEKGLESVQGATSWFSGLTQEYSQKLKDAVTSLSLFKKFDNLTGNTNMTFAMIESETERAYRMNSSTEIYAIQNAMKVAALIKALHHEVYRPTSSAKLHYKTRLWEEAERSRRVHEDKVDKAAIVNAKNAADLISLNTFARKQLASNKAEKFAVQKVEVVEEINKKPFAAAM